MKIIRAAGGPDEYHVVTARHGRRLMRWYERADFKIREQRREGKRPQWRERVLFYLRELRGFENG